MVGYWIALALDGLGGRLCLGWGVVFFSVRRGGARQSRKGKLRVKGLPSKYFVLRASWRSSTSAATVRCGAGGAVLELPSESISGISQSLDA